MRQMTIASLAAVLAAGVIVAPAQGAASRSDARAYGKLCQNQSKKRVSGSTGTPFSRCVTGDGPSCSCPDPLAAHRLRAPDPQRRPRRSQVAV